MFPPNFHTGFFVGPVVTVPLRGVLPNGVRPQGLLPRLVLLAAALLFTLPVLSDTLKQRADALRDAEAPSESDVSLFSGRLLSEFYVERDYRNAWDDDHARALLDLARLSREDGFDPADFHADAITEIINTEQLQSASEAERTVADILLSDALLRYIHHFRFGKFNPRFVNPGSIFVDKADAEALKADMEFALAASDMAERLSAMLPNPPFYRNLKRGYQRYLKIADRGDWQDVPAGANLIVGMQDARVPLVRKHLAVIDGYESSAVLEADTYDADLAEAVKGFQRRSGLSADGVIGPNTLRALNQPLGDRLLTIRANLERMRWLYNDLPADYLFVDVAAYRLQLFRDNEEVWRTPVVVGTFDAQTPTFRDEMEHIVFNPTWSVPVSIQKKMRGVSSRYQVVDRRTGRRVSGVDTSNYKRYRIVQPAGPSNALGRVKFMFPNGHAIYLHDTPSKHLFARSARAYSHGCIRVKDPLTLAQQLLDQPNWGKSEINHVVNRGKTRYVQLDEHLPVLLYYLTALADDDGRVGFRRDVYQRDKPLFALVDRPAHTNRISFLEPKPLPEMAPEAVPEGEQQPERKPALVVGTDAGPTSATPLASAPDSARDSAPDSAPDFAPDSAPASQESSLLSKTFEPKQPPGDGLRVPKADSATDSAPVDAATSLQTPLPIRRSQRSVSGPSMLRLDAEGRFADPAASVEPWSIDLRPVLPQALTLNTDKPRKPSAGASVLLPATPSGSGLLNRQVPLLLAPWPPEG